MMGSKNYKTDMIRTSQDKFGRDCQHACHEDQDPSSQKNLAEFQELKKERDDALQQAAECREDLEVWIKCTSLLSIIAGVDFGCYRKAFLALPTSFQSEKEPTDDGNFLGPVGAQKRLDEIQNRWSFNDTALPNLLQSIHRLQSNGCNLHHESEEMSQELRSTKHELYHCQTHNQKLQKAVKKLHDQNKKLKDSIKRKQIERKSILKNVGAYVSTMQKCQSIKAQQNEEYEEREIAKQLNVHERLLRMNKYKKDEQSSKTLNSSDSYDIRDSGMCLTPSFDNDETDADGDSLSIASSSISSVSSMRSLVTDDLSSTVRLESAFASETFPDERHVDTFLDGGRKRTKSDGDVSGWSSLSLTGSQRRSIISNEMLYMDECPSREERKLRTSSDGDVVTSGWSSLSFSGKKNNKDTSLQQGSTIDEDNDSELKSSSKSLGSMFQLPKISLPHKDIINTSKVDDENASNGSGNSDKRESANNTNRDGTCTNNNEEFENETSSHKQSFFERIGVEKKETLIPSSKDDTNKECKKDDSLTSTPASRTPSFLAKMGVMGERVSPIENGSDLHENEEKTGSSSMKIISPPSFLRSKEKSITKKPEKADTKEIKPKSSSSFLSPITLTTSFNIRGDDEEESKVQSEPLKSTETEVESSHKINTSMKNMSQKFKSLF